MRKLIISVYKEGLLLSRDIEGILLLFIMPLALVLIIALIHERSFQNILEARVKVLVVDFDADTLGNSFRNGIRESKVFDVTEITTGDSIQLTSARKSVAEGKYQIGIYIPPGTTQKIKKRAINLIRQQLPPDVIPGLPGKDEPAEIQIFFDPITKNSFSNLTESKLSEFAAQTESYILFQTYTRVIDAITNQKSNVQFPSKPSMIIRESYVSEYTSGIMPNSVQHNVPAWTLFGMFLICIPIAGNMIKERSEGCLAKLKTMPVSYFTIITGKSIAFIAVCLIQALLIFLFGIFILPLFSLPQLQIHGNWIALISITTASALAATGYGIAIGTVASTQIQASTFGSVSTVILAAIGGIWIPVLLMPRVMRNISAFSPMNWGIQGYYKVFLRHAGFIEISPEIGKLLIFYLGCIIVSIIYRKYHFGN